MIDKVYVKNLSHRPDRRYFMLGHLETIGVPQDKITIFEAIYGNDYASPKEVLDAAKAEGYAFPDEWKDLNSRTWIASTWTWCKMLDEIAEKDIIALTLIDDRIIRRFDWKRICEHIYFLTEHHSPFHVLQMGWLFLNDPETDLDENDIIHGDIAKGVRTWGSYGTVVSPAGAKRLKQGIIDLTTSLEDVFKKWVSGNKAGLFHYIYSSMENAAVVGDRADIVFESEDYLKETLNDR